MNEHDSNTGGLFSRATAEREGILEAFEAEWAGGRPPRIEEFIGADGAESRLVAELAATDLEYRLRAGEPARAGDYFSRFPRLAADQDAAVELIAAEYRLTSGSAIGDYLERYPQYAGALASRFGTGGKDTPGVESTLAAPAPEDDGPASTLAHRASAPIAPTPPSKSGALSDSRYRAVRFHAKGGIGEVHVAEDRELGREVALKRIQGQHADDPELRRRFLREAEVTARLQHPGIVPVYGLVADVDGQPCYAMRFIEGQSLKEAIERFHRERGTGSRPTARVPRRGADESNPQSAIRNPQLFASLDFRKLLGRFVDACNAIEYAHSRGVVHRDLKPANIMLGEYGETLVVDWGLAKVLGDRRRGSGGRGDAETRGRGEQPNDAGSQHDPRGLATPAGNGDPTVGTQMGHVLGTPQYMSPEQAQGQQDRVGPASDVYSLGTTLYTLLTGKLPFAGGSHEEVLGRVSVGNFVPPRQARANVPAALASVCGKAMSLEPSERYVSARALAEDVEHWLADEPVTAVPDTAIQRCGRWFRRHRALARSAAVALLAISVVSVAAALLVERSRRNEQAARRLADGLHLQSSGDLARLDDSYRAAIGLIDKLASDWLSATGNLQVARREARTKLIATIRQSFEPMISAVTSATERRKRRAMLDVHLSLIFAKFTDDAESIELARSLNEQAVAAFAAAFSESDPPDADALVEQGAAVVKLAELPGAEKLEHLRHAERLFLDALDHYGSSRAALHLAHLYDTGRLPLPASSGMTVASICSRGLSLADEELAEGNARLHWVYSSFVDGLSGELITSDNYPELRSIIDKALGHEDRFGVEFVGQRTLRGAAEKATRHSDPETASRWRTRILGS